MKRKVIYGVVMILCTAVISACLFYILSNYHIDEENSVMEVQNVPEKSKEGEKTVEEKNVSKVEEKIGDGKAESSEGDSNDEKKDGDSIEDASHISNEQTEKNISEKKSNDNVSKKNDKNEEKEIPVFKVEARTIKDSMSFADKARLLYISSKLSTTDEGRVKKYLCQDDAESGVKKAYRLLKERLDAEDMESIKEILGKYINIEAVEKQ